MLCGIDEGLVVSVQSFDVVYLRLDTLLARLVLEYEWLMDRYLVLVFFPCGIVSPEIMGRVESWDGYVLIIRFARTQLGQRALSCVTPFESSDLAIYSEHKVP